MTAAERLQSELRQRLAAAMPDAELDVQMEGDNSCILRIVSDEFEGLAQVRRQQRVYALLGELITGGRIHAVRIEARSRAEAGGLG